MPPDQVETGLRAAATRSNRSSSSAVRRRPSRFPEVPQVGHQDQVLLAGEELVHRRELAGDADRGAHGVGIPRKIVARDLDLAAVRRDQRREDVDRGRLAGAVRPEKREHRPLPHLEVDAVEDLMSAEGLAQPGHADCETATWGPHR